MKWFISRILLRVFFFFWKSLLSVIVLLCFEKLLHYCFYFIILYNIFFIVFPLYLLILLCTYSLYNTKFCAYFCQNIAKEILNLDAAWSILNIFQKTTDLEPTTLLFVIFLSRTNWWKSWSVSVFLWFSIPWYFVSQLWCTWLLKI